MAQDIHEVRDGLQIQLVGESVSYAVNTTKWGGTPTSPSVDVFDEEDFGTSLKVATMGASNPTVSGDDINLPLFGSLTAGIIYRIIVTFTLGGNTLIGFIRVQAK